MVIKYKFINECEVCGKFIMDENIDYKTIDCTCGNIVRKEQDKCSVSATITKKKDFYILTYTENGKEEVYDSIEELKQKYNEYLKSKGCFEKS